MTRYIFSIILSISASFASDHDVWYLNVVMNARAHISTYINNPEKQSILKHEKYKDTIWKVIPKAIADCALKLNEFENKNIEDNVVIFEGTNVKNYTRSNWNAVIFYTYLYHTMWNKETSVKNISKIVQNKYKDYDLSASVSDVEKYINELSIDEVVDFIICGQYTDIESVNFASNSNNVQFVCDDAIINYDNKRIRTPICIKAIDGKIKELETLYGSFEKIDEFFSVSNLRSNNKNKVTDIEYSLLNKEDIHDLPNSYSINGETYTNKCYMMATFELLHSSPTIRKLVDELDKLPDYKWYNEFDLNISHALKKIFANIENGTKDIAILCNQIIDRIEEYHVVIESQNESYENKMETLKNNILGRSSYRSNKFNKAYDFVTDILNILEQEAVKKRCASFDFAKELRLITCKNKALKDNQYMEYKILDLAQCIGNIYDNVERFIDSDFVDKNIVNHPKILLFFVNGIITETGNVLARNVTFKEYITIKGNKYKFISNIACANRTGYDFTTAIRTKDNKWYEVSSLYSSVSCIGTQFSENNKYAKYGKYRNLVMYELID